MNDKEFEETHMAHSEAVSSGNYEEALRLNKLLYEGVYERYTKTADTTTKQLFRDLLFMLLQSEDYLKTRNRK